MPTINDTPSSTQKYIGGQEYADIERVMIKQKSTAKGQKTEANQLSQLASSQGGIVIFRRKPKGMSIKMYSNLPGMLISAQVSSV